jgi:hypothetical protein
MQPGKRTERIPAFAVQKESQLSRTCAQPGFPLSWPEIFVSILKLIRFIIGALIKSEMRVDSDQRHQAKFNQSGGLIQ